MGAAEKQERDIAARVVATGTISAERSLVSCPRDPQRPERIAGVVDC